VAEAEIERPQPPRLLTGDYAPWFEAPALSGSPTYKFDTAAGRHMLLLFLGSAGFEASKAALDLVARHRSLFDDDVACFFGITLDPADAAEGRIAQALPGIRFFLDYDRKVSSLYGAVEGERYRPFWLVLTPDLRVAAHFPVDRGEQAVELLRGLIAAIPDDRWAPVLTVPDILEPALCRRLIDLYESDGGHDSGFMREVGGKTVEVLDHSHKQRRDCPIEDGELQRGLNARIRRRLNPALKRAFQFESTRIERHIVACYSAGEGHFRAHRDNTTKGTAHRKFAVTINLNSDYDGGDLRFPEYGGRTYRAPVGGAVVFSCSLLHEATPVTRGRRFAFLPFLYDEDGARIREANNPYLGEGLSPYRMEGAVSED
jgi:predicted 2-oxoglutarate/Fe(II)-dependent dioxygenase YbiX